MKDLMARLPNTKVVLSDPFCIKYLDIFILLSRYASIDKILKGKLTKNG